MSTQARPVQTDIRSCEADLDHALVLGRRYSVVPGVVSLGVSIGLAALILQL